MRNTYLPTIALLLVTSSTPALADNNASSPPQPVPQATQPTQPAPAPQVSRSAFTTGISNHEPIDQLARISAGQEIHYFTELADLQGHVITHRWEKDGAFQLGLQFPVGGQRWRVHSSKNIRANLPGIWTVTVQSDDGTILKQESLVVDPALPAEPTQASFPPPSQLVNSIPPETNKEPAQPDREASEPAATPAPESSTKPIWEKLPH